MKTFKIVSFIALFLSVTVLSFGQQKNETLAVSGNCGMCKSSIEKAAKAAGATSATWDREAKTLSVKYDAAATSTAKIQQAVANAGYDTRDIKATDEAYNKLHGCCKYDRAAAGNGEKAACCEKKDGKCDKASCKDKDKDCCTKEPGDNAKKSCCS